MSEKQKMFRFEKHRTCIFVKQELCVFVFYSDCFALLVHISCCVVSVVKRSSLETQCIFATVVPQALSLN